MTFFERLIRPQERKKENLGYDESFKDSRNQNCGMMSSFFQNSSYHNCGMMSL